MTDTVGLVIVSHSPKVAEGTADMARQMVGEEVRCAACGGDPGGGLGTDVGRIRDAIRSVLGPAGVAVFVDLGGAEMNAEMAIEMLEPDERARVTICNAPLVEGTVVAAVEAVSGADLEAVCAAAKDFAP